MMSALATASEGGRTGAADVLSSQSRGSHLPLTRKSATPPMWKFATGEPHAGKPPVRFGGRGGESLPNPYLTVATATRYGVERRETRNIRRGRFQDFNVRAKAQREFFSFVVTSDEVGGAFLGSRMGKALKKRTVLRHR